jgi:HSP20 family molecular chaperone IbpA
MEPSKKKLWKRIWWSCFMRDRLVALGMRRPTRIKAEDYDVPMLREEDFEVVLENNTLLISGSRSDLSERRAYHQMEIRFGKFSTAIQIPIPINVEAAIAEYKDGFLIVKLPRAKASQIKVE